MHAQLHSPRRARGWASLAVVLTLLAVTGLVVGAFAVHENTGAAAGEQNPATWLSHFQVTGVYASATPTPVPALLSTVAATPTRLGAAATSYLIDAGVVGHQALLWTFSETVGIPTSEELEISFSIAYDVGTVAHATSITVYAESQAAAIGAAIAFPLYWDAGAATGITFLSESEIVQACSAVGTCP